MATLTLKHIQSRLIALGFNPGMPDSLLGPLTLSAMDRALNALSGMKLGASAVDDPGPAKPAVNVIPAEWMPWAQMTRIIFHWTAGQLEASSSDRKHYHLLVEYVNGSARLVRGVPSIDLNDAPVKKGYAAHTLNANGDAIGTSICGMANAVPSPFDPGRAAFTEDQWNLLVRAHADLCRRYAIPVTPKTLLSHAEVQGTLGIKQRGKWDIAILPFDRSLNTPKKVGDAMRAAVSALL